MTKMTDILFNIHIVIIYYNSMLNISSCNFLYYLFKKNKFRKFYKYSSKYSSIYFTYLSFESDFKSIFLTSLLGGNLKISKEFPVKFSHRGTELELKQEKKEKKKRSSKSVQAERKRREKGEVVQTKKKKRSVKRRQGNKGKA